jgi:diguanylate cyclase (GGDEF)-like protein
VGLQAPRPPRRLTVRCEAAHFGSRWRSPKSGGSTFDGLKQINDRDGHTAGCAVLRAVGSEIRSKLRSYDATVRMGGEFVCAFSNTSLAAAGRRMQETKRARERTAARLDQLRDSPSWLQETLESPTARGDAALYRLKQRGS